MRHSEDPPLRISRLDSQDLLNLLVAEDRGDVERQQVGPLLHPLADRNHAVCRLSSTESERSVLHRLAKRHDSHRSARAVSDLHRESHDPGPTRRDVIQIREILEPDDVRSRGDLVYNEIGRRSMVDAGSIDTQRCDASALNQQTGGLGAV